MLASRYTALMLSLVAGLFAAACDNTFEPFDPSAPPFSIFGYLDASADTQWIRVNDLRQATFRNSPDPTGSRVTLQDSATGETIELGDTALLYGSMLGPQTVYAHDFWTTERLEPGATYRVRAVAQDGAVAETVVRLPREYGLEAGGNALWITGLKHVVFVISETSYFDDCEQPGLDRRVHPIDPGAPGTHVGDSTLWVVGASALSTTGYATPSCGLRWYTKRVQEVVGSEDEWPWDLDWSLLRLGVTPGNLPSTVSNSVGFLGGVLTKWIPIERCEFAYPSATEPYCKLRYDSTTATLRGSVSSGCPIPPDTTVVVQLRELEATPPEPPRIRLANHLDQAGGFEIGGLRPGIPHELLVFAGDTACPGGWLAYRDTLQFTAGQVTPYRAFIQHLGPCPGQ